MNTIFVSGSDTDVGKTWVTTALAREVRRRGETAQIVKPVETGISDPRESDAEVASRRCGGNGVRAFTLISLPLPIAPLAAARNAGRSLSLEDLIHGIEELPRDSDWRIIEGAGSLATPIDENGRDWADLAIAVGVGKTLLVVENRVGAIGQSRMAYAYAASKGLHCGVLLNERARQDPIYKKGTIDGVLGCGVPLWGMLDCGQERLNPDSLRWL